MKSKLSTAKKSKPTTFSRVFYPKKSTREIKVEFLDKKWRFRTVCLDTYLPSPVNICPSKSMAILKVGICTGPLCSSSLYSNPGLNSFKAKHGFFKGWKALLLFFFFFPLLVLLPENNSGKCMLGTEKKIIVKLSFFPVKMKNVNKFWRFFSRQIEGRFYIRM